MMDNTLKQQLPLTAVYFSSTIPYLQQNLILKVFDGAQAPPAPPSATGLRMYRTGTKNSFGGVAIYVVENLLFKITSDLNSFDHECLWIEFTHSKC